MALKDLHTLAQDILESYNQYRKDEFILPTEFKSSVTNINGSPISYYTHTAIIQKNEDQIIVLPNQWFAIASFFTEYKKELITYQNYAKKFFTDTKLRSFRTQGIISPEEKNNIAGLTDNDTELLIKFITDYNWWHGGKSIDRGDFANSSILYYAGVINDSQSYIVNLVDFFIAHPQFVPIIQKSAISQSRTAAIPKPKGVNYNQIYYGAPGTGKSQIIKRITRKNPNTRITFHPDTDYSAFVGSYKPCRDKEKQLTYNFVPQAFTKSYISAWKNLDQIYYLVIEEINRGNCAQIFGDIFQLLDRRADGFSEYATDVDTDLALYIESELRETPGYLEKISEICGYSAEYSKIVLPGNLYILATMNTSDQSLFPMDSAFKRRWCWEYVPINYKDAENLIIIIDELKYSWAEFLKLINPKIKELKDSEDKQLGNRFINSHDGIITFEQFRSKVMFYLWFEIFKDESGTSENIFRISDNEEITFSDFFSTSEENDKDLLKKFLEYNGISPLL